MTPPRRSGSVLDTLSWLGANLVQSWREDVVRALRSHYWNSTSATRELLGLARTVGPDSFAGFPLATLELDVRRVEPGDGPDEARAAVRVRAAANPAWDGVGTAVDADLDVVVSRSPRRPFMFFAPGRYGASVRDVKVLARRPG